MTEVPHWCIRPDGEKWTMETPTGALITCTTSTAAIEIATQQAQKFDGVVMVMDALGLVREAEDFSRDAL